MTFSLLHCQRARRVDASDMVTWAENVDMKKGVECQRAEEEADLGSWLGFARAV